MPRLRDAIAPFAELEKSPEHIHTYRLSPLSLWNAAAAGISADEMVDALATYSKFPLPPNLPIDLRELVGRYGRVTPPASRWGVTTRQQRSGAPRRALSRRRVCATTSATGSTRPASPVDDAFRGVLKQALIAVGYPAEDLAGYTEGAGIEVETRKTTARRSAVSGPRLSEDGG